MLFSQPFRKLSRFLLLCLLFYSFHLTFIHAQNYIARVEGSPNGWTLIDETGEQISTNTFSHVHAFSDGMAAARQGGYWGYIDQTGTWRIHAVLGTVTPFSSGLALVSKEPGKFMYLNKKGETVAAGFQSAYPCVDSVFFAKKDGEYVYKLYNVQGKLIDPSKSYKEAFPFKNGYGIVRTKEEWQIINTKGEVLFQNADCSFIKNYQNGMFAFRTKGKWGFIDSTFKITIEPIYNSYTAFNENYARVDLMGQKMLIGKDGKKVDWLKGYEDLGTLNEGMIAVKKNGIWGYVNIKDQQVIPAKFLVAKPFSGGIALVKTENELWGYINQKGEWQIQPTLYGGKQCKNGFALVKFGSGWGYIRPNGEKLKGTYPHAYSFDKISDKPNEDETDENSITD